MITVQTTINSSIEKVWDYWNNPAHITGWAFAQDDWECPAAENDLREGGQLKITMAAKDGSVSFDVIGIYEAVDEHNRIEYTMSDGRKVIIEFEPATEGIKVTESFDPEGEHSEELQRAGWQAILDNFKKYVESN